MQHGIGEADTTNHIQATAPSPNQMLTDHADDHNRFDRGVNRGPNQVISKTRAQGKAKKGYFSLTTRYATPSSPGRSGAQIQNVLIISDLPN